MNRHADVVRHSDGSGAHQPGHVIAGHYALLQPLARGGMGSVWTARHTHLGTCVALKFVRTQTDNDGLERLVREAQAAASVEHPAIVRVHDVVGVGSGEPCVVMELLDGPSLARHLAGGMHRLDPVEAVRLLLPIAGGLAAAHARGVVHRDVKPANIVLARAIAGTQPKLVDFGVARLGEARRITHAGCFVGTPHYASPEQVLGLDVDARADVWSLGAVLYECVAGQRPFVGKKTPDVLRAILESDPVPLTVLGVDPVFWEIVRRALEKPLARRWPDMAGMGGALARWLVAQGVMEDAAGASVRTAWTLPRLESAAVREAPACAADPPTVPVEAPLRVFDAPTLRSASSRGSVRARVTIGVCALAVVAASVLALCRASSAAVDAASLATPAVARPAAAPSAATDVPSPPVTVRVPAPLPVAAPGPERAPAARLRHRQAAIAGDLKDPYAP